MTDLAKVRRELAGYKEREVADGRPRFLFRGQRAIYPSIKSTFSRVPNTEMEVGQAYTVYRYAKQICQGLRGYTIDHLDGVAVLQHYGWPTPLVDVTGTPEVALFFALHGASVGSRGVVYAIDTQRLPEQVLVVDHEFFTHPLDDGGLRHRWVRQDGFALTTRDWRAGTDARDFDLLNPTFAQAIEAHEFVVSTRDRTDLADVLSTAGDPIPRHLQNLLRLFAQHQFEGDLAPKLAAIVDGMWNENAS
ncbi:MAG TPA: FRG domain-containing protein [Nitrospira sp.]|nr:FRG domain-containing protein [Nitrospira sp.]